MRIVFFNHFHRGDLFTHKEFIRHLRKELPLAFFEYWHYNHPKVNLDLGIPLTNTPHKLDQNVKKYEAQDETYLINTWIGVWGDIFAKHGGVNLQSLHESWSVIFDGLGVKINPDKEVYFPDIDYTFFDLSSVNEFVERSDRKRILFCNGKPMSNQSFDSDMSDVISKFAYDHPEIDFICTKKFDTILLNVLFTDDIIKDTDDFKGVKPFWNDRPQNTCDLNEISYLSTKCNAIVGKNSGPFVFCETARNLKDPSKVIVSFSKGPNESMSNGVDVKCKYRLVTDHSDENIKSTIEWVITKL